MLEETEETDFQNLIKIENFWTENFTQQKDTFIEHPKKGVRRINYNNIWVDTIDVTEEDKKKYPDLR